MPLDLAEMWKSFQKPLPFSSRHLPVSFLIAHPQGRWYVNLGPDSDPGTHEPGVSEQIAELEDDMQALVGARGDAAVCGLCPCTNRAGILERGGGSQLRHVGPSWCYSQSLGSPSLSCYKGKKEPEDRGSAVMGPLLWKEAQPPSPHPWRWDLAS